MVVSRVGHARQEAGAEMLEALVDGALHGAVDAAVRDGDAGQPGAEPLEPSGDHQRIGDQVVDVQDVEAGEQVRAERGRAVVKQRHATMSRLRVRPISSRQSSPSVPAMPGLLHSATERCPWPVSSSRDRHAMGRPLPHLPASTESVGLQTVPVAGGVAAWSRRRQALLPCASGSVGEAHW